MFKTIFIFVFVAGSLQSLAQIQKTDSNYSKSELSGIILETKEGEALPFVHIFNKTSGKGAISDLEGSFSIPFNTADTIIFSAVGFEDYIFIVSNSEKLSRHYFITIKLSQSTFELSPLTIFAFKDEASFKSDILNLKLPDAEKEIIIPGSFTGTPQPAKTRVYLNRGLACDGCITSILNLFNKEVKESKKYKRELQEEPRVHEIYKKYNPEIVQEITGLREEKLVEFMDFCKLSDDFIIASNEYDLMISINNCFEQFIEISK